MALNEVIELSQLTDRQFIGEYQAVNNANTIYMVLQLIFPEKQASRNCTDYQIAMDPY